VKERRVPDFSLGVDHDVGIHIRAPLDKPVRHVDVVEFKRQVQECTAGHGRGGIGISRRAIEPEREDLAVRESALQKRRISVEMLINQSRPDGLPDLQR
jgi:hypothetical protein